jgi:hypothetical protein
MSNGLFIAGTYPAKRQITEETIHMKAIVVTDQGCGNGRDEAGGAARAAGSDKRHSDVVERFAEHDRRYWRRWTCDGFGTAPSTPPVSAAIWGIPAIKSM